MNASLNRIIIYAKDMQKMAAFYKKHFDFVANYLEYEKEIELNPINSKVQIRLLQAAKSLKQGQVLVKLVFDVKNVEEFVTKSKLTGLSFGKIHKANGYSYANTKDPGGNNLQVSSRAFKKDS